MAKVAFGTAIEELTGRVGNTVFTQGHSGPIAKAFVMGDDPHTPAQMTMRQWMRVSAEVYRNLTAGEAAAGEVYAQSVVLRNTATGQAYHPTAYNAFNGLTVKWLQANGGGSPPVLPPSGSFAGDTIGVTASGLAGSVLFSGSGGNGSGIVTELLLQALPSPRRKPNVEKYRTQRFVSFGSGILEFAVGVLPGWVAPAVRFVNAGTGQMMPLVPLPMVRVL